MHPVYRSFLRLLATFNVRSIGRYMIFGVIVVVHVVIAGMGMLVEMLMGVFMGMGV